MPKKSTKAKRNKCDKLWREIICRDGRCEICRSSGRIEAHHLISRSAVFFRHNLNNGIALCAQCHKWNLGCSAHASPWAFEDWLRRNKPDQYAWWTENRHTIITGRKIDYDEVYKMLAEGADG